MANDKLTRKLAQVLEEEPEVGEDPVPRLARLIDRLRPSRFLLDRAEARMRTLIELLDARPDLLVRLRELIWNLFALHDALPFYTEVGSCRIAASPGNSVAASATTCCPKSATRATSSPPCAASSASPSMPAGWTG